MLEEIIKVLSNIVFTDLQAVTPAPEPSDKHPQVHPCVARSSPEDSGGSSGQEAAPAKREQF